MSGPGFALVTEHRVQGDLPLWTHPGWEARFAWLAQGVSGGAKEPEPFDLGLSGDRPAGEVLGRWRRVRERFGMGAVHSRQVHGARVRVHAAPIDGGLLLLDGWDGHLTALPEVLLAVSVADCVPVTLVDPERRVVAAVHAGWRGVAGGIVEEALRMLAEVHGSRPDSLLVHLGPAICGRCYEVGPEVHRGVHPHRDPPAGPTPIDLRAALGERALAAGVRADGVSISTHCTLCGPGDFFSHRGGRPERQMSFVGIRSGA